MPKGNKKFDIDLKYGQEREDRVVSLLMSKKEIDSSFKQRYKY